MQRPRAVHRVGHGYRVENGTSLQYMRQRYTTKRILLQSNEKNQSGNLRDDLENYSAARQPSRRGRFTGISSPTQLRETDRESDRHHVEAPGAGSGSSPTDTAGCLLRTRHTR